MMRPGPANFWLALELFQPFSGVYTSPWAFFAWLYQLSVLRGLQASVQLDFFKGLLKHANFMWLVLSLLYVLTCRTRPQDGLCKACKMNLQVGKSPTCKISLCIFQQF